MTERSEFRRYRHDLLAGTLGLSVATILIVDDRPVDRIRLASVLRSHRHTIVEALDGDAALRRAAEIRPDVVICSVLLPTLDGYEFVRGLRQQSSLAAASVIFMSPTYHEREARAMADQCGVFDVLIGINLLREGLDLPEVSLVAILDADKEGYLRSTTSLIQTMGRCARHVEGRAILYADRRTNSMNEAISETNRRRDKQLAYNAENGITPQSIIKGVDMELAHIVEADYVTVALNESELDAAAASLKNEEQLSDLLKKLEGQMRDAAKKFEFEKAAQLRDRIRGLKQMDLKGTFSREDAATAD